MAGAYVVTIDGTVEGRNLFNGVDTAVVFANNSADAKAIAEASFAKSTPAPWAAATPLLAAAAGDMAGWKLRVRLTAPAAAAYDPAHTYSTNDKVLWTDGQTYKSISGSTGIAPPDKAHWSLVLGVGQPAVDQTVTGAAAATVDSIAALMVTALNADPSGLIAAASYDATGNVLTLAETTDDIGNYTASVEMYAAGSSENVPIPGFVTAITHQGSAGAHLTATLAADSYTIPKVIAKLARS